MKSLGISSILVSTGNSKIVTMPCFMHKRLSSHNVLKLAVSLSFSDLLKDLNRLD